MVNCPKRGGEIQHAEIQQDYELSQNNERDVSPSSLTKIFNRLNIGQKLVIILASSYVLFFFGFELSTKGANFILENGIINLLIGIGFYFFWLYILYLSYILIVKIDPDAPNEKAYIWLINFLLATIVVLIVIWFIIFTQSVSIPCKGMKGVC